MSAHMAEYTGKNVGITEPRKQRLASAERQLFLEAVPERSQLQSILASAWAILSAADSEENDATINVLHSDGPLEIVPIRLHLAAEHSINDVQGVIQQRLHRGIDGSNAGTSTSTRETPKKRLSLQETLISSEMDGAVRDIFLKSDYVLAITCQASTSDDRPLVLRGYYHRSKLDDRDCRNVLDRVGNLFTQLSAAKDQKVGDLT